MKADIENPAAWADADRAPNSFKFAAVNGSEITPTALEIQAFRIAWIARRARLPLSIAAALAPLAFGGEGASCR